MNPIDYDQMAVDEAKQDPLIQSLLKRERPLEPKIIVESTSTNNERQWRWKDSGDE